MIARKINMIIMSKHVTAQGVIYAQKEIPGVPPERPSNPPGSPPVPEIPPVPPEIIPQPEQPPVQPSEPPIVFPPERNI